MKHIKLFENWNEDKIDQILDKINLHGIESLTDEEKRILSNDNIEISNFNNNEYDEEDDEEEDDDIESLEGEEFICDLPNLKNYDIRFNYEFSDIVNDKPHYYGSLNINDNIFFGYLYLEYNTVSWVFEYEYSEDDEYKEFNEYIEEDPLLYNNIEIFFNEIISSL